MADRSAEAGGLGEPATSPEQAREAAEAVLARPEYADARPNLLEQAWRAVRDWLGEVLGGFEGLPGAEWVGLAVLTAAVAALGWVALVALRRVRRSAATTEPAVTLEGRDAGAWRAEAAAHEEVGAWREAVRCHYRALLAELVAAGRVDDVPGRTPREYLGQVAAEPALRAPVAAATADFEAAWYGHAPAGREQAARMAAHADEVRRLVAGGGRGERRPAAAGAHGGGS